ncbi:hypothetical protein TNCV_993131 [Trichonephila clavipes]|nr:hypothetical protein TNCV_993131 [Trichonephila clavipes]
MTRRRVENRERSLGYPGFVTPVFTKDSKSLGKKEKITRALRDCDTRTHLKKLLETLTVVPSGQGSNPGEGMDVCKCIVAVRHVSTLNIRKAASPLVRLVEEESCGTFDHS